MMVSRTIVCAATLAAVFTGAANAADLPARLPVKAPPVPAATLTWTGAYIGLFAGYGWGDADATSAFDANTGFFYNWTGNPYSFDVDGFFGGGTLGYNWQSGSVVYGLEGEVGYLGLKGSAIDPNFQPGTVPIPDTETRFKSSLYGAIYGRLGVASGNALFYGKGGVAFLDAKGSNIDPCADGTPQCGFSTLNMRGDKVMTGWSAGAGIEWILGQWSAKVEYAYFDFGSIGTAGPSSTPGEFYRQTIDVTAQTVKVGLNYRLGAPVVARY